MMCLTAFTSGRLFHTAWPCIGRNGVCQKTHQRASAGNGTLEEDIADQAGLHIAYDAMLSRRRSIGGGLAGNEESASKAFFTAWAQTWCQLATKKQKEYAVMTDPHAPSHVRVNAALSRVSAVDLPLSFLCALLFESHPRSALVFD